MSGIRCTVTAVLSAVVAWPCAAQTPDEFVVSARKAYRSPGYANGEKTLVMTNAIDVSAFLDRRPGVVGWVNAPGARNIRDLGGWTGLRPCRVFRGTQVCSTPGRPLGLTEAGRTKLHDGLGIRTDLDLRRADELAGLTESPIGPDVKFVHAQIEAYGGLVKTTNEYAKALRVFADERNYPVYFHCWGGADRTGMIAMLLESLCGVDEADVLVDYELTNFAGFPRLCTAPYFRRAFQWLLDEVGSNLAEKTASFIRRNYGLTDGEIASIRRNLAGTVQDGTPVVRGENAAFSSDGRRIAYQVHNGHDYDVCVLNLDTGALDWVEDGDDDAAYPCWSKSGIVVYTRCEGHPTAMEMKRRDIRNGFNLFGWKNGKTRRLTSGRAQDSMPAFTPDGQMLYFTSTRGLDVNRDKSALYRMNPTDPKSIEKVRQPGFGAYASSGAAQIAISPNGRSAVWAETESMREDTWRIVGARIGNFKRRAQLSDGFDSAYAPCWHPDGRHIAFTGFRRGDPTWGIYFVDVATGVFRRLCDGMNPNISPDGRMLLFDDGQVIRNLTLDSSGLPEGRPASSCCDEPEKVILTKMRPTNGTSGKLPAEANFGRDKTVFVRAEVRMDPDAKIQRAFLGVWRGDHTHCELQVYADHGMPRFCTGGYVDYHLYVESDVRPDWSKPVTITGIRTSKGVYISVDGSEAVGQYTYRGAALLDGPRDYEIGLDSSVEVLSVEMGTGWPQNVPKFAKGRELL